MAKYDSNRIRYPEAHPVGSLSSRSIDGLTGWVRCGLQVGLWGVMMFPFFMAHGQSDIFDKGWHLAEGEGVTPEVAGIYYQEQAVTLERQLQLLTPQSNEPVQTGTSIDLSDPDVNAPEIVELVNGLRAGLSADTPDHAGELARRFYEYVLNHIHYTPYFGHLKGPVLTLQDRSGNDFDQATLLIQMLRAAGIQSDYAQSVMKIPYTNGQDDWDLSHWLDMAGGDFNDLKSRMLQVLVNGGIPVNGTQFTDSVVMVRVWVRITLSDGSIHEVDPTLKRYDRLDGIDLGTAMGYDRATVLSAAGGSIESNPTAVSGLDRVQLGRELKTYTQALTQSALSAHGLLLSSNRIRLQEVNQLPTQIDFPHNPPTIFSAVPGQYLHTFRVQYGAFNGDTQLNGFNYLFDTDSIAGHKLALSFSDGTQKGQLWLDDTMLIEENVSSSGGTVKLTVNHPYASRDGTFADQSVTISVQPDRNHHHVIVTAFAEDRDGEYLNAIQTRFQGLIDSQGPTARQTITESLHLIAQTWIRETALSRSLVSRMANVQYVSAHRFGLMSKAGSSVVIDMPAQVVTITDRGRSTDTAATELRKLDFFRAISFIESALEHSVIEQRIGESNDVMSTIKALVKTNTQGDKTYLADSGNFSLIRPNLVSNGYSNATIAFFQARVNDGRILVLPEQPVQSQGIRFTGYVSYYYSSQGAASIGMRIGPFSGGYCPQCNHNTQSIEEMGRQVETIRTPTESSGLNPHSPGNASGGCPVNYNSGDKYETLTDMTAGNLSFSRYYNSSRHRTRNSMGYGWQHNLDQRIEAHTDYNTGLGVRTDQDAAPIIVALWVTLDLMDDDDPSLVHWMVGALSAQWAVDRLLNNAVSLVGASSRSTYIDLTGEGDYLPPPQVTDQLVRQSDGTYQVTSRFGTVSVYDSDHRLKSVTDIDGNRVRYDYEGPTSDRRIRRVADSFNHSLSISYDSSDNLHTVRDHTGRQVKYTYGNGGTLLEQFTDVSGEDGWRYRYDRDHRLIEVKGPENLLIKTLSYNSLGQVESQTWPRQGGDGRHRYYYTDFVTTILDELDHTIEYFMDDRRRVVKTVDALDHATSRAYDYRNYVIARTTALNQRTGYRYNRDHHLTDVTNALDEVTRYTYDAQHRNTRVEDPLGHQIDHGYDTKHHRVSEQMDTGTGTVLTSGTAYQSNGLVSSRTDPRGTATTFTYDQYGRTNTRKTSHHPLIDRDYDALGRLTRITDQAGAKTAFKYDARGKPTEIIDPLGRSTRMSYDDAGRLTTLTDRNGETSKLSYTASSQIHQVDYPGSREDVSFSYDLRDQVKQMVDGLGSHDYHYDDAGRLISQTDAHGFTVGYGYDGHGNLTRLTYPGNKVVTYGYDALNRLTTVTDWLNQTTTYHYDAAGRLTHQDHGNGTRTRYRYDDANRLLEQKNEKRDQSLITHQVFTLDANGNRLTEQRTQPQVPSDTAADLSYQYNAENTRLQSVTDETTNTQIETFRYDAEGQQIEKSGQSYGFDHRHRLVNQGNRVYHYDATDNRLKVETAGQIKYLIYDKGNNLLAEADANKQITRYYLHGSGLLSMIQNQQSWYYHFSATGHTLALTDSNQQVVNQYAYDPYGRILGESETSGLEQPFKYVGQYGVQHEGEHLYYMRARYYDAETGRFIKEDPIGIEGGLNLYLYGNGNPLIYIDSSGTNPQKYEKPTNPNKKTTDRSGTGTKKGDAGRERNRGIDEEHSKRPKGGFKSTILRFPVLMCPACEILLPNIIIPSKNLSGC